MSVPIRAMKRPVGPARIRKVSAWDTVSWLRKGWADLWDNPAASLPYGIYLAAAGFLIMVEIDVMPHLATAAVSGFLFFGPLAAAGLYDISRARAEGRRIGLLASLIGCDRHFDTLALYGLFLAFVALAWERLSATLFALHIKDDITSFQQFFGVVVSSGDYLGFVVLYALAAGLFALLVFFLSVISIPMLMDRDVDVITAMMTSARAVRCNLRPLLLWAVIVVLLVAIGIATMMVAMVFVLPWLGHASWHAYRDLVA